jgi:Ca2+-binding EF-hand superfamily protein
MILASELTDVLKKKGMNLEQDEINQIIKEVDYYGNGKINYSEFLVATMDMNRILSGQSQEQKMKAIFQQFDTDNSGFITKENIRYAMQKLGQELPPEEIDEILEEHDVTGDGRLSFDEFMRIFVSDTI